MKSFLCGLFFISCLALYINGQDLPPIPNSYRALPASVFRLTRISKCSGPDGDGNAPDEGKWKCHDCNTLHKCSRDPENPTQQITCGDQFPGNPYCNDTDSNNAKDKCVANADVCLVPDTTEFKCPGRDLYPSTTTCKDYYKCTAAGVNGKKFTCKSNTVFNYAKKDCISTVCIEPKKDCQGKYKLMPYRYNSTLYIECKGDRNPVLQDCGNYNFVFNPNSMDCEYVCKSEGKFGNPLQQDGEQTSYYQCKLSGKGGYNVEKVDCPTNEFFDKNYNECFPRARK